MRPPWLSRRWTVTCVTKRLSLHVPLRMKAVNCFSPDGFLWYKLYYLKCVCVWQNEKERLCKVCVCVLGGGGRGGGKDKDRECVCVFAFLNTCHKGKVLWEVKMNRTVTNQCCMFTLTATPFPSRRHRCIQYKFTTIFSMYPKVTSKYVYILHNITQQNPFMLVSNRTHVKLQSMWNPFYTWP